MEFLMPATSLDDLDDGTAFSQGRKKLLTNFEAPMDPRQNKGRKIEGYFKPPVDGEYRFHMSCDN